jgi:hypothetical protein
MWTSTACAGALTVVCGSGSAASASSSNRICSSDPADNPKRAQTASIVSRETSSVSARRTPALG